jgi:hypothetical protein
MLAGLIRLLVGIGVVGLIRLLVGVGVVGIGVGIEVGIGMVGIELAWAPSRLNLACLLKFP